jgi:hypothetical protein
VCVAGESGGGQLGHPLGVRGAVRSQRLFPCRKWRSLATASGQLDFPTSGNGRHVGKDRALSPGGHSGPMEHLDKSLGSADPPQVFSSVIIVATSYLRAPKVR